MFFSYVDYLFNKFDFLVLSLLRKPLSMLIHQKILNVSNGTEKPLLYTMTCSLIRCLDNLPVTEVTKNVETMFLDPLVISEN